MDEQLTVSQYIKQKGLTGKVWTCAHLVSNGKIGNPEWYYGIECTTSTVPAEIRDKKVMRFFKEGGFNCFIWFNDEDYHYKED